MRPVLRSLPQTGFTLMEMVVSLVVLGLLAVVMLPLLNLPLNAYLDAQRRIELHAQMDLIRSKLTDDLQNAVPGSLRVSQVGVVYRLEYLEIHAVGRYRTDAAGPPFCSAFPANTCRTTLGPLNVMPGAAVAVNVDYVAIVGAFFDPYRASPNASLSRLTARSTVAAPTYEGIRYTANVFPNPSPSSRIYVVSPVTYECNPTTRRLTRYWGYNVTPIQPNAFGAGVSNARLSNSVSGTCIFSVTPGVGAGLRQVMALQVNLSTATAGQATESLEDLIQVGTREP